MASDSRQKFIELIAKENKSYYLLTEEEYLKTLDHLRIALATKTSKTSYQYRLINRYAILKVGDVDKLVVKTDNKDDPIRYVVAIEQVRTKFLVLLVGGMLCEPVFLGLRQATRNSSSDGPWRPRSAGDGTEKQVLWDQSRMHFCFSGLMRDMPAQKEATEAWPRS